MPRKIDYNLLAMKQSVQRDLGRQNAVIDAVREGNVNKAEIISGVELVPKESLWMRAQKLEARKRDVKIDTGHEKRTDRIVDQLKINNADKTSSVAHEIFKTIIKYPDHPARDDLLKRALDLIGRDDLMKKEPKPDIDMMGDEESAAGSDEESAAGSDEESAAGSGEEGAAGSDDDLPPPLEDLPPPLENLPPPLEDVLPQLGFIQAPPEDALPQLEFTLPPLKNVPLDVVGAVGGLTYEDLLQKPLVLDKEIFHKVNKNPIKLPLLPIITPKTKSKSESESDEYDLKYETLNTELDSISSSNSEFPKIPPNKTHILNGDKTVYYGRYVDKNKIDKLLYDGLVKEEKLIDFSYKKYFKKMLNYKGTKRTRSTHIKNLSNLKQASKYIQKLIIEKQTGKSIMTNMNDLVERFKILVGEIESGNTHKTLKNELAQILHYFYKNKKMKRKDYKMFMNLTK